MAKRFGRNQRRKLLEQVYRAQFLHAEAVRRIHSVYLERDAARHQADNAIDLAFQRFMANENRVEHTIAHIARVLGDKLAEELAPIAQQILERQREKPRFSARSVPRLDGGKVVVLRGDVPRIEYNMTMMEWL